VDVGREEELREKWGRDDARSTSCGVFSLPRRQAEPSGPNTRARASMVDARLQQQTNARGCVSLIVERYDDLLQAKSLCRVGGRRKLSQAVSPYYAAHGCGQKKL
jgi:hypothetical protein